jgi:hypothetical protein
MTQPPPYQPPVMPGNPTQPPQGDWKPPAPRKRGPVPWLIGGLVVLVLVAGGLLAALLSDGGGKPTASHTTPPLPQDACGGGICNTEPAAEVTTPDAVYTPKAGDFKLTAKVTEKACFGSAGCNVTFEPDVTYAGTQDLDPAITWQVVYEINGVEDAPQVGNLTIEGTEVTYHQEDVSTKSSKSKITLKVTSVDQQ